MDEAKTAIDVPREQRRNELASITFSAGQIFQPKDGRELMDMANLMSTAGLMVKDIYRGQPGVCMGLIATMAPYGINPIQASWKTYQTKPDAPIAYEAQLIVAMLNASGVVKGGLRYRYEGEGQNRVCVCSGKLVGNDDVLEVTSPPLSGILPKNSPLWKSDPDQQLAYYTGRAWARRYKPEMLLGVYDVDEMDAAHIGPENARDVTPKPRGGVSYREVDEAAAPAPAEQEAKPEADEAEVVDQETGEVAEGPEVELRTEAAKQADRGRDAFVRWWNDTLSKDERSLFTPADLAKLNAACNAADHAAAAAQAAAEAAMGGQTEGDPFAIEGEATAAE